MPLNREKKNLWLTYCPNYRLGGFLLLLIKKLTNDFESNELNNQLEVGEVLK